MKKDLISIKDLTRQEIMGLFNVAKSLKKNPLSKNASLAGKSLALVFQKPSNRTRVSFEVGVFQLGGNAIYLGPDEVKLGVRESFKDAAKVLGRYADGIVARTFSHDDVVNMAKFSSAPVINGLSDLLHPCQGLSDLFTIEEIFGKKKIKIAFVGDGNNVLHSLLIGSSILARDIHIATPKGSEPDSGILNEAKKYAAKSKSKIIVGNDPKKCVEQADIIYTDVWVSMGEKSKKVDMETFKAFQVNEELLTCAKKDVLVMHCLPAHRGEEITDAVMDSKSSIVYDQAENRLHVQKAILLKLLGG
ncbi:MAG: ornithine carbamoyltransferase [Omnitrophica bacterium]|nr:ornithine carbamoyltransferase [Candidatus Omnitrophota bacterium]